MPIVPTTPFRFHAAAAVLLAALSPAIGAHAQSGASGGTVAGGTHQHKSRSKGNANQPAPSEHQSVQPSQRLQDEPNQVKEQVAPTPEAPVKPGSTPAPGQDTPKPNGG